MKKINTIIDLLCILLILLIVGVVFVFWYVFTNENHSLAEDRYLYREFAKDVVVQKNTDTLSQSATLYYSALQNASTAMSGKRGVVTNMNAFVTAFEAQDFNIAQQHLLWAQEKVQTALYDLDNVWVPPAERETHAFYREIIANTEVAIKEMIIGFNRKDPKSIERGFKILEEVEALTL